MATGAHLMSLDKGVTRSEFNKIMTDMATDPNIEYVEEDKLMQIMSVPSDPSYGNQWHYFESNGGLNLPDAWDLSTGADVVVAVIDTGYTDHEDLSDNLLPGYDMISDSFIGNDGDGRDSDAHDTGDATASDECNAGSFASDSSWHGTHVAGTVAAVANNSIGGTGVAFDAKILPVRALGKCGGYTSDISDSIIWAAGGNVSGTPTNRYPADVINLSLGGGGACDTTTQAAINTAVGLGATVVVAAGNSNVNAQNSNPANCANVVTVAAVGRTGGRASYSNFGNVVDIAAPGGDTARGSANGVYSTLNAGKTSPSSDTYGYYQGTSMAAPHVAGAVALMYSLDPYITPAEAESILKATARSFPATCTSCGEGIVDATAALQRLAGETEAPIESEDNVLVNGVTLSSLSGNKNSETFFTLEVPAGASDLSFSTSGGTGDADLYVSFNSIPTTKNYDCRPYEVGSNESCDFSSPKSGTYNVMVHGYDAYNGLNLLASFTAPNGALSQTNLSAKTGQLLTYTIDVPAGATSLVVETSGGTGDADLYLHAGTAPTTSTYTCRSWEEGNTETCTITDPEAATWYIGVHSYQSFSGVTLQANTL